MKGTASIAVLVIGVGLAAWGLGRRGALPDPGGDPWAAPVVAVSLELAPADLEALRKAPRTDVPVTVRLGGQTLSNAQVHLKGHGSFRPVDDQPSFTVSWSSPDGPRRLHLENSLEDPSRLHAFLGGTLFREAGIPIPEVRHAQMTFLGRPLGLQVLRPGYDREYSRTAFGIPDGVILEPVGGADVDGVFQASGGHSPEAVPRAQRAVARVAQAAGDPDLERRWAALERCLDVRRFATLLAGEALLGHWDGYGVARNNYRIHWDPTTDRCVFLPHGMDQLFPEAAYPVRPTVSSLLARAFLETRQGRDLYDGEWTRLRAAWMDADALIRRVRRRVAQIEPHLTTAQRRTLREESRDLERRITQRCAAVARAPVPTVSAAAAGTRMNGRPVAFPAMPPILRSNMASIVTRTGDAGTTGLMYNRRVPKSHPRVEAYGGVDELNAALGMARAATRDPFVGDALLTIQKQLVVLMGELATGVEDLDRYVRDGFQLVTDVHVTALDDFVKALEAQKISFTGWATPGANPVAAALDLARTVCRRAERRVVALHEAGELRNADILVFLNRLSDLLWLMARQAEGTPGERKNDVG